jgi:tetratricopeptide (TPR) repeat protein
VDIYRARYEEALKRGHSYSWDQRWQEAINEFEKAIENVAEEPAPYAGLGMAYFELGEFTKALESYKLAARNSRGDMIYLKHVADVQERLGQLTEAGQTYMALGEIQLKRRKLDEAVGNWLRAVSLEPNLLGGHQRLAAVYRRQGLTSNAIREYLAMARIYQMRGDDASALKTCNLALELDPSNVDVLTAMNLIREGEEDILVEQEVDPLTDSSAEQEESPQETLQRMTTVLEAERKNWQLEETSDSDGLLHSSMLRAQQELAQDIFVDEEDELSPNHQSGTLSKLERDALISQALDFQTRDMVDEAIDCFDRAIKGGVNSLAAHYCLGLLYLQAKRPKLALQELAASVEDQNYRSAGHYAMAEVYELRGDKVRATEHFVTALKFIDLKTVGSEQALRVSEMYDRLTQLMSYEAEPEEVATFVSSLKGLLGGSYWQDEVARARHRLNRLSSDGHILILGDILAAGSLQVLESLHLSQTYAQEEKYDSAVEEAYRAIQLSPYYLAGHIQLAEIMAKQERNQIAVTKFLTIGDTYQVRGDINGAIENYERAVELLPMELSNRSGLISILVQQGFTDQALEHYMVLGEAYYNLAEMEKARETYLEAFQLIPNASPDGNWRSVLLQRIADIDMQRLDWKRALAAYKEIHDINPEDESISLTLIDLYYKVGQPDAALAQLDNLLIQLVRKGQVEKVTGILEELIDQRPLDMGLVDRLSRLYVHQGRNQDAIAILDKVGEAQLDAGQTRNAAITINQILQLDPPNAASYRLLLQRLQQSAIK